MLSNQPNITESDTNASTDANRTRLPMAISLRRTVQAVHPQVGASADVVQRPTATHDLLAIEANADVHDPIVQPYLPSGSRMVIHNRPLPQDNAATAAASTQLTRAGRIYPAPPIMRGRIRRADPMHLGDINSGHHILAIPTVSSDNDSDTDAIRSQVSNDNDSAEPTPRNLTQETSRPRTSRGSHLQPTN